MVDKADKTELDTGRMLDMMVFYRTLDVLGEDLPGAEFLANSHLAEFIANVTHSFKPVFDMPGFRQFRRGPGGWTRLGRMKRGMELHRARGNLMARVCARLQTKRSVLQDIFGQGVTFQGAIKLGDTATAESREEQIAKLASIRMVSNPRLRSFVRKALQAAGAEVSSFDDVVTDVEMAQNLGNQLRDVSVRIATETDKDIVADLEAEAVYLKQSIEELSVGSTAPAAVQGAAATSTADKGHNYRTEAGRKSGLSPDQEDAMMVRGKSIISAGAGSGKCLDKNVYITASYGMKKIGDCSGKADLKSVDADNLTSSMEQGTWLDMGTSPVYELRTASGIKIKGTPEHPLLVWDGAPTWKKLEDMRPDDHVLLLPGHAIEAGTPSVDPDEAYLIGLWMGNGYTGQAPSKRPTSWSSTNEHLIDVFYALSEKYWGHVPSSSDRKEHYVASAAHLRIKAQGLLPDDGVSSSNARVKKVPAWLMGSSAAERVRFLQGLFDTDGCVGDRSFEYSSASEELAHQVHQMMLGLGVVGRLKPKDNVKGYEDHTYWRILVAGDQIRKFKDLIGFRYDMDKQGALEDHCQKECNPNTGCYPHVGTLLKSVREEWKSQNRWDGGKQGLYEDGQWPSVKDYLHGKRRPSNSRLKALVSGCSSPEATLLGNLTDFYPDPVVSCVLVGEEHVYDFTVPTTHSFIANGIVSHNTRVLAAKVSYHINELGALPHQIMATSFSKKSAEELISRIKSATGKGDALFSDPGSEDGFGTTHSISYRMCRNHMTNGRNIQVLDNETMLLKKAMAQVTMSRDAVAPDMVVSDFFDAAPVATNVAREQEVTDTPAAEEGDAVSFPALLARALAWWKDTSNRRDLAKGWGVQDNYRRTVVDFLSGVQGRDYGRLSKKQQDWLLGSPNRRGSGILPSAGINYDPNTLTAAAEVAAAGENWFKVPANQWFNLGVGERAWSDKERFPRPVGPKQVALLITNWKGDLLSPTQVAKTDGATDMLVAAYGAYEWLKENDSDFAGKMTFDDMLIKASGLLISNPNLLAEYQSRYRVVLVDESQDLNKSQHLFFGLLAGYMEPSTRAPNEDGSMSADTYCFIGDDRQAIYGFRGARPEVFIDLSTEHGFDTKLLETNYRSGGVIVDSAEKLIAHNTNRIPKVCTAMERKKSQGIVEWMDVTNNEEGALESIRIIKEQSESGDYSYSDFGVACRTNAEIYSFVAECLKNQIPFKVPPKKFNVLNNKLSKAIIDWAEFVVTPMEDIRTINKLITTMHRNPNFILNDVFNTRLAELAGGQNYLDFLNNGGWNQIYNQDFRNRNVRQYMEALNEARRFEGRTPAQTIDAILNDIKGSANRDGSWEEVSMADNAIHDARRDPSIMDMLSMESTAGTAEQRLSDVTDDQVRDLALAQAGPIIGLFEGQTDMRAALDYLAELQDANKKLEKPAHSRSVHRTDEATKASAVQIDTIHGWKGLECRRIFVPMAEGTFPHVKSKGDEEAMAAERRLAYVAITRGQEQVTLIAPQVNMANKPAGPSSFIFEACVPPMGTEYTGIPDKVTAMAMVSAKFSDEQITEILRKHELSIEELANKSSSGWDPYEHVEAMEIAGDFSRLVLNSLRPTLKKEQE